MGARQALSVARMTVRETLTDDVGMMAASLSYRFLLALFPFFIALAAVSGGIADLFDVRDPTAEIMRAIGNALPEDARNVLEGQLSAVLDTNSPGLLSFGLLGALWAAAGGVGATIKAMNRAYDVEETRPFWRRTALALGLTVLGGVFVLLAFLLLVAGGWAVREVVERVGASRALDLGLDVARFALAGALVVGAAAFLYWAAPNASLPFRWITPGAVLFVLVWVAGTVGLGFYVANFASYNATYGALGGVVVLMVWFYLTAYILLVGAELNAVVGRTTQPQRTPAHTEAEAEPQAAGVTQPRVAAGLATARARAQTAREGDGREGRAGAAPSPASRSGFVAGALANAFVAALVLRRAWTQ